MPDTLAECQRKFGAVKSALSGESLDQIVNRVALEAKKVATDAVSPNSLSHWGRGWKKGGYRVQARYLLKGNGQAVILPTVPALAALLTDGAKGPWHNPKRKGSKRRKKGTGGTYQRAPVPPRAAWTKAQEAIKPVVPKEVDKQVQQVLRQVFG